MKSTAPLLLFALLLGGCGQSAPKTAAAPPPVPVEVFTAATRAMPVQMKAIGTVEPVASVQLKSKVQGEIMKVHFADGAPVQAGEVLFTIDSRTFETALKRAEANLSMAQSTAANATEQARRYTTLIQRGVASKEQTSLILATAQSQKSELDAKQADVDDASRSLEWSQVKAPISGRAGAALLKAGNIAQASGDTLVVINQMKPIYVSFSLPENSLTEVRKWMNQGKPVVSAFASETGAPLGTGELDFVDNTVDRASGMITFKAIFPNTDEKLWPGQFVDVNIKLTEDPDALVVPSNAVMEGQKGSQVFVVKDGVATLRKITVERTLDGFSIIKQGLQPGEQVITVGQLRVNSGARVAVKAADQAASVSANP